MLVVQCFAEIDRQLKGDACEPGTERSKLFLQRTLPVALYIFLYHEVENLLMFLCIEALSMLFPSVL